MNIVGISAYYHDAACCLLKDGRVVAAAAEERFSRRKHDARLPIQAFRFCLAAGRLGVGDVDCVAYYERPDRKLPRQLASASAPAADALRPEREIREVLGHEGPIECFEHHRSHAASAYYYSGFAEAAILTVDGVGEWATTTYGLGRDGEVDMFEEVEFPHSLGLLYSTLTGYLGFEVNDGEHTVMGLAPYGKPRFTEQMRVLLRPGPRGQYALDLAYFDFGGRRRMHSPALCDLLGAPPRAPGARLSQFHRDVACSLQVALEDLLLEKVRYLHGRTGSANLCLAGGVALNCVANGRIRRDGPFERLFVPPAPGDDGGCLGAAALAHARLTGHRLPGAPLTHAYLGPRFSREDVARLLSAAGVPSLDFRGREPELLAAVADRLAQRAVVGWFHGAMEFGPRALGARSILADPRDPDARDRINRLVKRREAFRPFAPSVLQERAWEFFELDHPSPFMLETARVRSPGLLPAITHVDASTRPQTVDAATSPRFAALLHAFARRTGCPVLLNTSFNTRGEPIVCTPADALRCMVRAGLDLLVLEDFVIERRAIPDGLAQAVASRRAAHITPGPSASVYPFV
ncbi:MAG: carbamoyltransferase family protein [Candidatus Rokuibacteriota bacterium]